MRTYEITFPQFYPVVNGFVPKIKAITIIRELFGFGLKEAKDISENFYTPLIKSSDRMTPTHIYELHLCGVTVCAVDEIDTPKGEASLEQMLKDTAKKAIDEGKFSTAIEILKLLY